MTLLKEVGYPIMVFDGKPYVCPELERLVTAVRADSQRTWVGLTDEKRFKVAEQTGCMSADWLDVIKATETALQIKNQ